MDNMHVDIYGCNKCESLTMVEKHKSLNFCGVCGEKWNEDWKVNKIYFGGNGTVTDIIENG